MKHEREAVSTMRDETDVNNPLWEAVRPQVDAALSRLPAAQRDAVVARYLCGLSEAEAATRLHCPLNTLHSRVKLGLEKLRAHLRPAVGGTTAMALGTLLLEHGTELAPAHLVTKVSGACLIKGAATAEALAAADGVLKAAAVSKASTLVVCTIIVLASATAYVSLSRPPTGPVSVLFQEDFEKANGAKWEGERQTDPLNTVNHVIKTVPMSLKYGEGQFFLVARTPWDAKGWEVRADTYVRFRYFARKFSTQQGLKLQAKRSDGVNFGGFMTTIVNDHWETVTARLHDLVLVNDPKQAMPERAVLHEVAWCIYTKEALPEGAEFYVDDVSVFRTADEIPVAKFQAMSE
jgi:hypothetical protein